MNEQLVVKNFGPIKDATVDFKRVTVFIGPTGGGKSTLAKLAAIFLNGEVSLVNGNITIEEPLSKYNIASYKTKKSTIKWSKANGHSFTIDDKDSVEVRMTNLETMENVTEAYFSQQFKHFIKDTGFDVVMSTLNKKEKEKLKIATIKKLKEDYVRASHGMIFGKSQVASYMPAERQLVPALNLFWPSLLENKVELSKIILDFAKGFLQASAYVIQLEVPFLSIRYEHDSGKNSIRLLADGTLLPIHETASGIQSVTPLLVLLEHLSHNTEQAQSFIIEEPELNLYPTAQQGLLNWLVEKCTKGENDLTITTHSPYILSHLNLLLYAYQVAEQHPDRRAEVAAIVPEASWINPKEFACYQVEGGGVQSLVDDDLGLIDNNELDALSGDAADAFDKLIRLSKAVAAK